MWIFVAAMIAFFCLIAWGASYGKEEEREQYIQECIGKGGSVVEHMNRYRVECVYK